MKTSYDEFLNSKRRAAIQSGFHVELRYITPSLFDWQAKVVQWAVKMGKAALFEECGMGKTRQQIEWARLVHEHTGGNILILAPLAVNSQTIAEGKEIGVDVNAARSQSELKPGLNITNYEMLEHFDCSMLAGVVLDESSILKSFTGATRNMIIDRFRNTPYKLACTATPAPNDHMEIGNHAEFLGVMSRVEMLSMYFVHDGGDTAKWRIKGHAEDDFWKWVASWSVTARKPSDLGFIDDGFVLPELRMHEHIIEAGDPTEALFTTEAQGLLERRQARRASLHERVAMAAEKVNATPGAWVVWCDLNDEGDALADAIPGSIHVQGSDSKEHKSSAMMAFSSGEVRVMISKPSICGFGMNWQHCPNVAFVGLSDSWEMFYQAVRRCWRFGQKSPVDCHIFISEREGAVLRNIQRKEADAMLMGEQVTKHTAILDTGFGGDGEHDDLDYVRETHIGEGYTIHRGDCVEVMAQIPDESIDYSIFSPPFASLYTYSNSERDMGNNLTYDQFKDHFSFLVREIYRTLKPGRLVSLHCFDIPAMKQRDGFIGLIDFPADLRQMFQDAGFIYHSKVTIWKDPVVQMQRTKALGLLHKQIRKDSSMCRQGLADYLLTMRKPGDNPEPISHTHETFPVSQWQEYASPVWMDIDPSRTLQREGAREEKDERHICPLQLDVIERALQLWTNPGDTVLTPFAGIGSEVYSAIKDGRVGIGIELKNSYYKQAVRNCELAILESKQQSLF